MGTVKPRLIAFYLPQYHPIPENDKWWGKGFTEWSNVVKARPLYKGHYQPHIPADLGFYDLRVSEVREAQADLARYYGITGFCYYHYWFNGKELLERPFKEVLESGRPDFPFCLCWANENWTRTWDGKDSNILISQEYSEDDDLRHIRALLPALKDSRYILYQGKPLILIYRASNLPNPQKTINIWRNEAVNAGLQGLYICRVESFLSERTDPLELGFDAAVEFQPDWQFTQYPLRRGFFWRLATKLGISPRAFQDFKIIDYEFLVKKSTQKESVPYKRFSCVTPMWDNSPRKNRGGMILRNSTPQLFKTWLRSSINKARFDENKENLIFINAWNEWGEGNHLEPDIENGHAYLNAILEVIKDQPERSYQKDNNLK